jgi:hypothetical protein
MPLRRPLTRERKDQIGQWHGSFSLTSVKIFAYGVGMTQFTFAGYRNGVLGPTETVNVTSATSSFENFNLSNMTDVDEVRVSNNSPAEAFNFAFDDMAVAPYAASLSLSPTTLSAATVAAAYSQTITASGGTSPYTYAVTAGALPAGCSEQCWRAERHADGGRLVQLHHHGDGFGWHPP